MVPETLRDVGIQPSPDGFKHRARFAFDGERPGMLTRCSSRLRLAPATISHRAQ
jgi:hypothetical protein